MANNLFPDFLNDPEQYELSERFWESLWERVDPSERDRHGWISPWLGTGSPSIKDGNPIFSAYSSRLGRGIRVIQEEPSGSELDIQAWLDTFGGDAPDLDRIHELVISCVLSDVAARMAQDLMSPWVRGQPVSLSYDAAGRLLPINVEETKAKNRSPGLAS